MGFLSFQVKPVCQPYAWWNHALATSRMLINLVELIFPVAAEAYLKGLCVAWLDRVFSMAGRWGRSEHCSREWGLQCGWESLGSSSYLKRKEEGSCLWKEPTPTLWGHFNAGNGSHHNQEWPETRVSSLGQSAAFLTVFSISTQLKGANKRMLCMALCPSVLGEKILYCSVCSSLFWCVF